MYEVNAKLTKELIEKFDNDDSIFWRFQDPNFEITGEFEESWGMIYSSREEAIEEYMNDNDCDYDEAEDSAILPGKSCTETFEGIMKFYGSFFLGGYVLMAFSGFDTRAAGHDDESVATFHEPVAIFSIEDVDQYTEENSDF